MDNLYRHLYQWYEINHRILPWRETEDGYAIWLSEIILQQTRVAQGMEYYLRFMSRWPKVEDLAQAEEEDVLREWQGLGYYSRARNLHKAAKIIVESTKDDVQGTRDKVQGTREDVQGTREDVQGTREDVQGTRDKGQGTRDKGQGTKDKVQGIFPKRFEEILALPGVGEYTAGAICSFAYNQPYPAMDGNVYRVVARLLDIDEAFDTTVGKKLFRQKIEELLDRENPRLFNSAIMEFGALYCTPVLGDACQSCPLQECCLGYAHGTAELLPVRKPRPKVRDRWFTYHVYVQRDDVQSTRDKVQRTKDKGQNTKDKGQSTKDKVQGTKDKGQGTREDEVYTLIQKRENAKDIWYHLYEFPCEETNEQPAAVSGQIAFTHVLSHQKIHARFIVHTVQKMPELPGTIYIRWEDLNDYALSRLTLRALDIIQHKG